MRKFYILILLIMSKQIAYGSICGSGYVHLQGRQFIDQYGSNFYPLVLNYNILIVHDPVSGLYYATPDATHGLTDDCECHNVNDCNTQFQTEFAKIVAMGFNTIRTDLSAQINYDASNSNGIFSFSFKENVSPFWNQNFIPPVPTSLDFDVNFTNQASIDFFNIITNYLDQACAAGLKVIFVTGGKGREVAPNVPFTPVYSPFASAGYAAYLTKLASITATKHALLAYDLWNEPIYSGLNSSQNGGLLKQDICNYEKTWYDAIRVNDQNHLITLGGSNVDEMFHWDMGLLKLDFYSMHLYPSPNNFMLQSAPQTAITDGMNEFEIICYWMGKVCPMPWIIGETGFSADDNTFDTLDVPVHLPPYMFGSEAQQNQFAQLSLDAVRNNLASGYSWWTFQNVKWWSHTSDPKYFPSKMYDNFQGLLHYGNGIVSWTDKPAVSTFYNYLDLATHTQPPAIVPATQPANYYNPKHIYDPAVATSLNPTAINAVSGIIHDDKGNPIKDAVVYGTNWLETLDAFYTSTPWIPTPNPNDDKFIYDSPFTFSHSDGINNGSFQIVPFNYNQPSITNHRIVNIRISAVGAERDEVGTGWIYLHGYGDQQMSLSNVGTVNLKRVTTGYDAVASNETVNGSENYYGWNSLAVNDLTINGTANLTAQNEINVHTEFHASNGSEVHIYTSFPSNTYPECGDFTGFARSVNPSVSNQTNSPNEKNEIELQFSDSKELNAVIYPNPNSGIFIISVQNPLKDQITLTLENLIGETLWTNKTSEPEISVNFNFLSKGVYLIHIKNANQSTTKKLIIN